MQDALKKKCEELERELSEERAKATLIEVQGGTATTDEVSVLVYRRLLFRLLL